MALAVHPFDPLVQRLLIALGLEAAETQKVVISIQPDDVVRVYAVLIPNHDDIRRVSDAFEAERVADVRVSDQGDIDVTPLG